MTMRLTRPPSRGQDPLVAKAMPSGWTELARYILDRSLHHPLSANGLPAPFDVPFEDLSVETRHDSRSPTAGRAQHEAQITSRYARTAKAHRCGEIGYEGHHGDHTRLSAPALWLPC